MPAKQKITDIVRRNLWNRGYAVKSLAEAGLGFHLLVENKYRVYVASKDGKIPETAVREFVVAIVSFDAAKRPVIVYVGTPNKSNPTVRPQDLFGLPTKSKEKTYGKKTRKETRIG